MTSVSKVPLVIDLTEDDEAWAALDEVEGRVVEKNVGGDGNKIEARPKWLPEGLEPVLEELPKWNLLADILLEAEGEIIRQESMKKPGSPREWRLTATLLASDVVFLVFQQVIHPIRSS